MKDGDHADIRSNPESWSAYRQRVSPEKHQVFPYASRGIHPFPARKIAGILNTWTVVSPDASTGNIQKERKSMVKVLLAEKEGPARQVLCDVIRGLAGSDLAWDVYDVDEALKVAGRECPDLMLLSHGLMGGRVAVTIRSIAERASGARILVLSNHNDSRLALRAVEAGASGYLLADRAYEELADAVRTVMAGRTYLSPGIAGKERAIHEAGQSAAAVPCVLVVDDDEALRIIYDKVLKDAGYAVLAAATAEEAIALLQTHPPSLAFVDLVLPGASGVEVIRQLKALDETLPVVVVTGYPDSGLMHQALSYSPLTVLLKPFQPRRLVDAARSALAARVHSSHTMEDFAEPRNAEQCAQG